MDHGHNSIPEQVIYRDDKKLRPECWKPSEWFRSLSFYKRLLVRDPFRTARTLVQVLVGWCRSA